MQTEAQENLSLKEVSAGEPYRMRRVAPRANNLIDGSRHGSVDVSQGYTAHAVCTTGWTSGDLF
jgi:hypothetical protein